MITHPMAMMAGKHDFFNLIPSFSATLCTLCDVLCCAAMLCGERRLLFLFVCICSLSDRERESKKYNIKSSNDCEGGMRVVFFSPLACEARRLREFNHG